MEFSIYFTETRDFKLIKDRIMGGSEDYLVYVYADTRSIKLPRDLIRDLPVFGNNIIWVDSADMDSSQLINHVVLTIGQYFSTEEEINFFIAARTARFEKAIQLLASQGIPVEHLGKEAVVTEPKKSRKKMGRPVGSRNAVDKKTEEKKTGKPGRPKKEKAPGKPGRPPKEEASGKPGKPGRPPKDKAPGKPGRPPKDKAPGKPGRPPKEEAKKEKKARKPRVDKPMTEDMVEARLTAFPTIDPDVELMQKKIFSLRKVQRPKFDIKLNEMIQAHLAVGESEANTILNKMKETGMMDNSGVDNRIRYKD